MGPLAIEAQRMGEPMNVRRLQVQGFLVATVLCAVGALVLAWARPSPQVRPACPLAEKINPNSAPVASLVRLPQIGPARARAVVAYRDEVRDTTGQAAPFRCSDDLQGVSGIGPKTAAQIADWLVFHPPGDI